MSSLKKSFFSPAKIAALITIFCGLCVLVSWQFKWSLFDGSLLAQVAMNPLTAITFILLGLCLFGFADPQSQLFKYASPIALIVMSITLLKALSFYGIDFKLDQILFANELSQFSIPNRMAPNTALNFFLLSGALFFQGRSTSNGYLYSDFLVVPTLFISMTSLTGYIYSNVFFTQMGYFIPMAFNTTLLFLAMCIGILSLYPEKGLASIFSKKYAGAKVGRRVLPYIILTPLILGWLRVQAQHQGYVNEAAGASLMAMAAMTLGLLILCGSANVVNHLEENLEQKKIAEHNRNLNRLKRFFPPAISEKILSGEVDDPFKWHRNDVTVIFLDIRGFTSFAEYGEPEEVMTTLQNYYQTVARVAQKHNGSIGHLAGDGVMIFFNDPVPIENPQKNAVMMVLELRNELDFLCKKWRENDVHLHFGAGIASGYTTIGGIGSEGFWDYTIIGTAPNIASRLCHAASEGQILISKRFLNTVQNDIEVEDLGLLNLKGIHHPVMTYNIKSQKMDLTL